MRQTSLFSSAASRPFALAAYAVALLALTGCPREPVYRTTSQTTLQSGGGGGANLSGVQSKLEQLDEWNLAAGSESIVSELNEWIRNARPVQDWRRDPLIDELPTEFQQLEAVRAVGGDEFQLSDVQFLAERRLLHATSDKIVADGISAGSDLFLSDEPLAETSAAAPSSGRLERTPREKTTLLFDWTIRNIVLQPMMPAPAAPTGDITGSGLAVLTRAPGAGYTLSLDQALLRGQGDAWMRLRTFVALCEQQGIRAVALGAPTGNRAEPQSPRLAGVLLDDQLLLFDLALGLPIPNGKGGVASFEELKADPSLWKSAVETAYGGEPRPRESAFIDPAKMVAYVAADPSSLSRRMATLEQEWSGAGRVRLTVQPSVIAARLKEVAGIERTEIWNQPIESMIFESSIAEFARRGDPSVQEFLRVRQIFSPPTPIYFARKRYLTGPETVNGEPVTAIATLMESSLTEAQLDEIETSREVQKMLGYDRVLAQIPDPQQKRLFLQQARQQFGIIKKLAKYYVGFAQYQIPDFEQAVRWFEDAAALSDEGIWRVGSYYNLGRSLEALGRYPAAAALYRQDKSIQRPMSILRAAKLSERAGLAAADGPTEPAPDEETPVEESPAEAAPSPTIDDAAAPASEESVPAEPPTSGFADGPIRLPTREAFRSLSAEQAVSLFETATADLSKLDASDLRVLSEVVQDKEQPATSYAVAASILVLSRKLPCPILDFKQFVEKDFAAHIHMQPSYSGDGWPEWFTDFDNGIDGAYYVSSERLKEGGGWILVGTTNDIPGVKPDATAVKVRVLTVEIGPVSRTVSTLDD